MLANFAFSFPFNAPESLQDMGRDGSGVARPHAACGEQRAGYESERGWLELVRDAVAAANSGGGELVAVGGEIGWETNGLDPAGVGEALARRVEQYTGESLGELQVRVVERAGRPAVTMTVPPAGMPIGFTRAGTCADPAHPDQRREVFAAGSFYFRRGARSEPGTTGDMRAFFDRALRRQRAQWLRAIRRAVRAPVETVGGEGGRRSVARASGGEPAVLKPVRIVSDPAAPVLQPQDVDRLYPWRQKELLGELKRRLGRRLNSYDLQAVRRQHRLDERPDFVFRLAGAGRRYSPSVADWIAQQHARDPQFFECARAADRLALKLRRQKPR